MNQKLQKFIDGLIAAEQSISRTSLEQEGNQSVVSAIEDNKQQTGGKTMGRFSDRVSQYPGRIKLTKVADDGSGTIYDCVAAEGEVTNEGTPLNAETLNALAEGVRSGAALYCHRVRLAGSQIHGVVPVGVIEIYSTSNTVITTRTELSKALDIWEGYRDVPAAGCKFYGENSIFITNALISENDATLYGMYFGFSSDTGVINRVGTPVISITDEIRQVM